MSTKILLGAVVIIVVLSAIFLYISGTKKLQIQKPIPTETPSPTQVVVKQKEIVLVEQNKSGQSGTVTLREENGKTTVLINISESQTKTAEPAHIHIGSCDKLGIIKYPLEDIVDGKSETVLEKTIDELLNELPLAVNVHKSAKQAKVYVSCGDLEKAP